MGTPEFAVPSLEILVNNKKNVVTVVTAEDKPQGRGKKAGMSAIKVTALKYGIKILQPSSLKSLEFIDELKSLKADLQVVVAFRMLPEIAWSMPPKGTFNLHASLLPHYRGAAPINWAIINGEKETGVTTFFLKHEIDTGEIIFQEKEPIQESDDAGTLYERLMMKGANLVLKTVEAIERAEAEPKKQEANLTLRHAPKIFNETCKVDWRKSADQLNNFIKGLSPYPGAWTEINSKTFKVYKAVRSNDNSYAADGTFKINHQNDLLVKCSDSWLCIADFQPEGKKRMSPQEFLRGNKLDLQK